ncbi:MAG: glycosyltransferase family 4 protein [Ignavibacteria bacterium]|nr:glycosyltransferase family 4 protein [Ignavibacteria bacterium]
MNVHRSFHIVNVCLATYQSISLLKGGPRTQMDQTKRCLETLGARVLLFETWGEFQKEKIDLVHLFGAHIGTYHLAREIHKVGIPIVVTPIFYSRHSPLYLRTVLGLDRTAHKLVKGLWTDYGLVAEICSWAKVVLPNTQKEARLLNKGLGVPMEKITVVPNGVEERFYRADPSVFKKHYGIENFVLNVGHIGPARKNVLHLIRALEKVNTPAVVIGRVEDNEYGRACFQEAKKNPRLLMLTALPNDSELLASAYAACDVFVLPSLYETPGIAALEAALAGAKIVITKHGGTEEYFSFHAEYIDPSSYELIQHGIITALNKEKNGNLREHIRSNYLWEHVAKKTMVVYEGVLSRQ